MVVLIEPMDGVKSAAMQLIVPAGAMFDLPTQRGCATVVSEMTLRGAGSRDSRELTNALDLLGLQRSTSTAVYHTRYSTAAVASKVMEGLPIYADIIQRPMLTEEDFEASRELALQSLAGLDDEPRSKALVLLREKHWPEPVGLNTLGTKEGLESLTWVHAKQAHARMYHSGDAVLSIAGDVDPDAVLKRVEATFGTWKTGPSIPSITAPNTYGHHFVEQPSEQAHIALAYPSHDEMSPDYYVARIAGEILSGGTSGRLFTEIREKRGLCYSVGVSYTSIRGRASMLGYAGTSIDRAQATLDCMISEIKRFSQGVTLDEVNRAKIGLKASVVMSGESTSSRASANASDFFYLNRARSLDEIKQKIDEVTLDRVNQYVAAHPAGPFTVVVLAPKPLEVNV
jgi:predicted Zn-dependent peptidase